MTIPKPNKSDEYSTPISVNVVRFLAVILLVAGAIMTAVGFAKNENPTIVIYGLSCIVVCTFLFIIGNLSENVHKLTYLMEKHYKSNMNSQDFILRHLQKIEEKMLDQ